MLLDYEGQADKSKHKHLHGSKNFSYLLFIGTQVQNRGEGLAKELIRQQQAKASEQDLPIWLEATTILSRDVYLRCGFQAMDEICLGKGTHNENGNRERNGTGVTIWSMVWYPTPK